METNFNGVWTMSEEYISPRQVGSRLSTLRIKNDKSKMACADALGCCFSTYDRYEGGRRLITTKRIAILVKKLYPGTSVDWILFGE